MSCLYWGYEYYDSYSAILNRLRDLLVEFYNATIYYRASFYLVFKAPAIAGDRVIKVQIGSTTGDGAGWHHADSWTSGSTVVQPVKFAHEYSSSTIQANYAFILYPDVCFVSRTSLDSTSELICILGKLSNGEFFAGGFGYTSGCYQYNTSTGKQLRVVAWSSPFWTPDYKLYKQSPILMESVSGKILVNSNGTPATLPEIYNLSHPTLSTPLLKDGCYITKAPLVCATAPNGGQNLATPLMVEFPGSGQNPFGLTNLAQL